MHPRFDVFRKQAENFIKWVGTAKSLQEVEKLIQADSGSPNTPEDEYVVVHLAFGTTKAMKVIFDHHVA